MDGYLLNIIKYLYLNAKPTLKDNLPLEASASAIRQEKTRGTFCSTRSYSPWYSHDGCLTVDWMSI